jgi:hypothetical protein
MVVLVVAVVAVVVVVVDRIDTQFNRNMKNRSGVGEWIIERPTHCDGMACLSCPLSDPCTSDLKLPVTTN